jgi:hypothetical protein
MLCAKTVPGSSSIEAEPAGCYFRTDLVWGSANVSIESDCFVVAVIDSVYWGVEWLFSAAIDYFYNGAAEWLFSASIDSF